MRHPNLDPQPDIVERVVAALPPITHGPYVPDWPEDEQDYCRNGDWVDFSDREVSLQRIRRVKAARDVLAALGIEVSA